MGYLRDIRRLTVALSRARLGLYILGRRDVFENCYELREAFGILFRRPSTLLLVPGEMVPTQRGVLDEVDATEMVGVEHLGLYVHEMTQAKIQQLGGAMGPPPIPAPNADIPESGNNPATNIETEDDEIRQPEELDL